jgi:predicted acyltransferase
MPLNKRLYGITFLFLVLSISAASLSSFLFLVDIVPKTYKKSAKIIRTVTQPLTWLGLNPLAIFVIMQVAAMILNNWITFDDD